MMIGTKNQVVALVILAVGFGLKIGLLIQTLY